MERLIPDPSNFVQIHSCYGAFIWLWGSCLQTAISWEPSWTPEMQICLFGWKHPLPPVHRRDVFNAAKLPNCSKVCDWDSARNLPFMAKTSELCFVCLHVNLKAKKKRCSIHMLFSTAIGNIHCGDRTHAQPESPKPEGAFSSTSARARMMIKGHLQLWLHDYIPYIMILIGVCQPIPQHRSPGAGSVFFCAAFSAQLCHTKKPSEIWPV